MSVDLEVVVRLGAYSAVFLVMALWEARAARRSRSLGRLKRWPANLSLPALGAVLVRLVLPVSVLGVALLAQQRGWGLLTRLQLSTWVSAVLSVVALDLVVYAQHVVFHAVPVLWRLHMVHHADPDFDLTTGVRFHPLEVLLSALTQCGVVLLLGAPPVAVLVFEVVLNGSALFNHGNVSLPGAVEKPLRWLLVTPDMHRVHHSVVRAEANSNFGFCLSWWDRLFRTYRAAPAAGHDAMQIGLLHTSGFSQGLASLLLLPFRGEGGGYAMAGRRRKEALRGPEDVGPGGPEDVERP
jgi:sterol desaturase/sphingolipid hydroxylase (fatty acid hydroxylase superfamily)